MATDSQKLVVAAVVREALHNIPHSAGSVLVSHPQRQIMAHAFPYIDVKQTTEEELLDQLRGDIEKTLARLGDSDIEPDQAEKSALRGPRRKAAGRRKTG